MPKPVPGDKIAVLSPSVAAPALFPAVYEQGLRRLAELTGLTPVEFPTTRQLNAPPEDRARDITAAFTDPSISAVLAVTGGDDQITVVRHLDPLEIAAHPKPFIGYSDNTNLHNFLWKLAIDSYYGGSVMQFGSGPCVDDIQAESLRAALMTGGSIDLTEPGESQDFGINWSDPRALTEFGDRDQVDEPWTWAGPAGHVQGRTWGGCLEVIEQLAMADLMPSNEALTGAILLLETSEEVPSADKVKRWFRALGERGTLAAVAGVLVARPPTAGMFQPVPPSEDRAKHRAEQYKTVIEQVMWYNPEAVICAGVPFGHTSPQWIVPYGGPMRLDGKTQTVTAYYE